MKHVIQSVLLIATFLVCTPVCHAQTAQQDDWEFVPLTGGHVSFFVPNPFNENDLFAVAESPHVFYSSDRGRHWRNISGNLRDVMSNKPVDLAVTQNGWIYLTGCDYSCLIRSTDWGKTWEKFDVAGADTLSSHSTIFSKKDGRLWLFSLSHGLVKYSDDNGVTWIILDTPLNGDWRFRNISLFPTISTYIALGRSGFFGSSTDAGQIWSPDSMFNSYDHVAYCSSYELNGKLIIYLWAKYSTRPIDPKWLDYYESEDTGRTWVQRNVDTLYWDAGLPFHKDNSRPFSVAYENGTLLSVHNNQLYRSSDRGVTWSVDQNTPLFYDLFLFNDTLFTSMPMVGIVRSTDTGRTWFPVETLGDMALFESIRLQVVGGYLCALVNDAGKPLHYIISSDGGQNWTKLFETEVHPLDFLVTMDPEPRYTILYERYALGGSLLQAVPDTVVKDISFYLAPIGSTVAYPWLVTTKVQPGLIYFVARDNSGAWLYRSTDGGKSWLRSQAPPYWYGEFRLLPSQVHPDRLVAVCGPWNSTDILGMGIWYIRNFENNWEMTLNRTPLPGAMTYGLFGNDVLFNTGNYQQSLDYGRNWEPFDDGLINGNNLISMMPHPTDAAMFLTYEYVWYYFNGTRWQIFDQFNKDSEVWRYQPQSLWYDDNTLWGAFPGHGIYKISNPVITSAGLPASIPGGVTLSAYPNPARNLSSISYTLPERRTVTLTVYDGLGREVAALVSGAQESGVHTATFDCAHRKTGTYFYRLTASNPRTGTVESQTGQLVLVK